MIDDFDHVPITRWREIIITIQIHIIAIHIITFILILNNRWLYWFFGNFFKS